jgi:hypothetical protein
VESLVFNFAWYSVKLLDGEFCGEPERERKRNGKYKTGEDYRDILSTNIKQLKT